jgi:hypothetical protein
MWSINSFDPGVQVRSCTLNPVAAKLLADVDVAQGDFVKPDPLRTALDGIWHGHVYSAKGEIWTSIFWGP